MDEVTCGLRHPKALNSGLMLEMGEGPGLGVLPGPVGQLSAGSRERQPRGLATGPGTLEEGWAHLLWGRGQSGLS